jgi:hypothetical protein
MQGRVVRTAPVTVGHIAPSTEYAKKAIPHFDFSRLLSEDYAVAADLLADQASSAPPHSEPVPGEYGDESHRHIRSKNSFEIVSSKHSGCPCREHVPEEFLADLIKKHNRLILRHANQSPKPLLHGA